MYYPKHFKLYELVDKESYETIPHWKLWLGFDERVLRVMDIIREELGVSITINDWKWGGKCNWRGLRNSKSKYYSQFSQHSFGRALDFVCSISAVEVRKKIKKMLEDGKFKGITDTLTLEHTIKGKEISWVHIDLRNNPPGYHRLDI